MSDKTFSLEWIQNEINYYSEMCVSVSYFDYLDVLKQLRTVTAKIARLVEVGDAIDQELLEFGARGYGKTELRTAWLRAKEGKE